MRGRIETWQHVAGNAALLERASGLATGDITGLARLRSDFGDEASAVALELVLARRKAAEKFGDAAETLIADVQGVEQASGQAVARYKAHRIRNALGTGACIVDLCCGIGGDTLALCEAELAVTAIDREPTRAWMARHNSGNRADAVCMDAADWSGTSSATGGCAIHLDPARRNEGTGRRAWKLDDLQPAPAVIAGLIAHAGEAGAAVKLSPGVDLQPLDALVGDAPYEVGFIAEHGRLVQAVLWTGKLRQAQRSATLITRGQTHTLTGSPDHAPTGPMRRYLHAVHPAVERAGLIGLLSGEHDAALIHPKLGLLTSDTPIDSPWLTEFELLAELPWRPKKVRQWLGAHNAGIIEVKTRGKAVDPDAAAKQLRGKGETPYTVFVLRWDVRVVAMVCRRIDNTA